MPFRPPPFRLLPLACCLLAAAPWAPAADDGRRKFDIPAGEADPALRRFASQAGRTVLYSGEAVAGENTAAVRGEYAPREALTRLLAPTRLLARHDERTGAISISRAESPVAEAPSSHPQKKTEAMTTVTKSPRPVLAALVGWLGAATAADAQQTATPPKQKTEIIALSPFEVTSTKDTGYAGQDTLAGSRLRTNLRDIPAAISPITAEFISDIAAINVEDVMEYAPSTRMEVEDGRAAPVGENVTIGSQPIRIRGLAGGGRSINFFQWGGGIGAPAEIDMYMVESAELSRGPNSILFGIGSPAGRFNVATKQARTDRPRYSLSHRIDNWDGQRWVVDLNSPLVKDRLAVRAVALRGRDASWRAAGHSDQDRVFLATKWQPDRKTSVRVEFEDGRIDRFTSRPSFGIDLKAFWEESGRPTFNNFSSTYVPGTPGTGTAGTPGSPIRDTGVTNVDGIRERAAGDLVIVSPSFQYAQNYRQFTASDYSGNPLFNDFTMGRANPKATPEANWVNAKQNVRHGSVFITRELAPNLNLELAFNRMVADLDSFNLDSWGTYGIAVDTNRYLPNGQLKPANLLYHYDVSQERRLANQAINQYRVALAYERTWRDDLVRLRMAGLGERTEAKWQGVTQNMNWFNGPSRERRRL